MGIRLSTGSAADAYGLLEGDEIAAINGVSMDDSYQGSVLYVINQAVRTGLMELKIRRYPFAGNRPALSSSFSCRRVLFTAQVGCVVLMQSSVTRI